jgi:PRTRC genetic system protein B
MEARVAIGANRTFVLRNAVLVYGDGATAFATLHPVVNKGNGEPPYLGPGKSLTSAFLKTLAVELGAHINLEILPTNVLARTPDMITWWTPSRREVMFFGGTDQKAHELSGAIYPHPALVFKVADHELFVRALAKDDRPTETTPLKIAPYWNVDCAGRVCLGSTRVPDEVSASSIPRWTFGFFRSQFTHPNGAVRLTTHPQGFIGLWKSLKNSKGAFPIEFLADASETLLQFVERG